MEMDKDQRVSGRDMNLETARVEHLKLIQAVVDRQGRNSFAIKSAAAAVSAALAAFVAGSGSPAAAFAGLAVVPLWALDARFLAQERGFRRLYDSVRIGPPADHGTGDYFDMTVPPRAPGIVKAAASPSASLFHVSLLALVGASFLIVLL